MTLKTVKLTLICIYYKWDTKINNKMVIQNYSNHNRLKQYQEYSVIEGVTLLFSKLLKIKNC